MSTRQLEAVDVLEVLERKLAYLPGGRDREGRPLLLVNVPIEHCSAKKTKFERLAEYLLSIFNEETRRNGVCVIIDARLGSWRVARSYIRRSVVRVRNLAARVIVLRPEGFWEKRVDNCTKARKDGEPIYIPITRLGVYVETVQLPYELGGTKFHDHARWTQTRMRVEEYTKKSEILLAKMVYLRGKLCNFDALRSRDRAEVDLGSYWEAGTELAENAQEILISGRNLLSAMSRESSQDCLDTVQCINKTLDTIELEQVELEKGWTKLAQNLDTAREINDLEAGMSQVTNWILGPADFMLNSRCQVGYDVTSSENLRMEHEELELECRNAYVRYAELLHRIDSISEDRLTEDIKTQKNFMDFVFRNFATRLEKRRNLLITSQRFFRLVSGYFDRTSEVFDKLVMGNRTCALSQAGLKLRNLEKSQAILDGLQCQLEQEGEKLSEILSTPIKDAVGREVLVDYSEDIANIRDILDASNARKNIFNDSVELQKLTVKQMALIYAYENDAEQAVKWLNDLFGVILENHAEIGSHATEIRMQKEEHQTFQDTAKGTFDYGYQLANGARVLRISCRLELESNTSLALRLRQAWKRLRSVGQEQLTRLRVCTVFHRSVDEHFAALNELIDTIEESFLLREKSISKDSSFEKTLSSKAEILREVLDDREKLLPDVGRTLRLGRLLRIRLKEPLYLQKRMSTTEVAKSPTVNDHVGNLTAVDAISERLAEVTRLAQKLDERLYEAGARIRNASRQINEEINEDSTTTSWSKLVDVENLNEAKKSITTDKTTENFEKNCDNEIDESFTEDYVTATECTTPMARSRSESFASMSEDDDVFPTYDFPNTWQDPTKDSSVLQQELEIPNDLVISQEEKQITPSAREMAELSRKNGISVPDGESTSSTSIIEKVEEKSGKIMKEVTETTTLRVSHDTRFGVASYKLTSNTLREAHEHTDVKGILDTRGLGSKMNGDDDDKLSQNDEFTVQTREEMSVSNVDSPLDESENNEHSKFTKIIRESYQREHKSSKSLKEDNNVIKSISYGLETRGNNDSGIEMTPAKNDDSMGNSEEADDLELVMKLKTVSRSQVVVDKNSTVTNLRTIH